MSVDLLEIRHYKDILPNGLTVVTVEMPHIHTMEVCMLIRAGLRFESENNNGISHFLEHMMFRGSKNYPDSVSLSREFEQIGRELRASTMSEYTYYGFSPHVSHLERGMDLFAEFFSDPLFAGMDLEREIILEEFLQELNEAGENVDINNHACRLLYKGNNLAMPVIGNEKNIRSFTPEMLRAYYQEYYNPGNMVLAVAGCTTRGRVVDSAMKYFSRLPRHGTVIAKNHFQNTINQTQTRPQLSFQHDSDSQVQLQICFRAFSYKHPDYYKTCLISSIFDDGITSRLQRSLREERALVYSIASRATCLSDLGTFDFDAAVRPDKTCQVAEKLLQEIKSFVATGPTQSELDHVRKRYFFDMEADLDDPGKQILHYAFTELYSAPITPDEERAIIEKITVQDLTELARKIFLPSQMNMILVGPYTEGIKRGLENLANSY